MTWWNAPARGHLLRSASALAAVLTLGACEFPTEAPIFQSRYVVPSDNTSLSVSQLLPSSVTIVNGSFVLGLAPVSLNRTLGELCGACAPFNGQTVPFPGFTASVPVTIDFPADVAAAVLSGGTIQVALTNAFGFDPLNPPGAATGGTMVITITNGSRTLGTATVTGPFPTGTTKTTPVALAAGNVSGPINVAVAITSPAGGIAPANFVTINTNGALAINVTPQSIIVTSATVPITNKLVSVTAITLDLSEIDSELADRAVSGAIILKMTNPFAVAGTLQLRIAGGAAGDINKSVALAAGVTTQRVEFTGAELRSILGRDVTLTISGPVSGVGGNVTITPAQSLAIETSLDLVVQIGGTVN